MRQTQHAMTGANVLDVSLLTKVRAAPCDSTGVTGASFLFSQEWNSAHNLTELGSRFSRASRNTPLDLSPMEPRVEK